MTDDKPTRDQTHAAIDNAVAAHVANIGLPGILASWSLVGSLVYIDEDGDECETLYQSASSGISRWQNIGLLSDALNNAQNSGALREVYLGDDDEELDD